MPANAVEVTANYEDIPHTHTASTTWYNDVTNHWHLCTAGDNEKMDIAKHIYGDWVTDKEATETQKGSKYRVCNVCKYRETAEISKISVLTPKLPKNYKQETHLI